MSTTTTTVDEEYTISTKILCDASLVVDYYAVYGTTDLIINDPLYCNVETGNRLTYEEEILSRDLVDEINLSEWGLENAGKVIGFNAPRYQHMDGEIIRQHLGGQYILKEYQGQGIGKLLLKNIILFWKSISNLPIYLTVVDYNENGIIFYERNGFIRTGKLIDDELVPGYKITEIEMVYNH